MLALGGMLFMFVGRDFFPIIDGGQIQLHVRAPAGTRIEKTEQIFQAIEDKIREVIPRGRARPHRRQYRLAGPLLQLRLRRRHSDRRQRRRDPGRAEGGPRADGDYIRKLREVLPAAFPEDIFYFQAADMVTQILNFGIPAQINVRTVGYDRDKNLRIAKEMQQRIAAIPGRRRRASAAGGQRPGILRRRSTAPALPSSASP